MGCLAIMLAAGSANAISLTVGQIIYQSDPTLINPNLLSGTVNVSGFGTSTLTFDVTNTTAGGAFSGPGAPSNMLLTDFGFTLGGGNSLSSGSATVVTPPNTALNFDTGQSTTNISNRWGFANQTIDGFNLTGVLPTNTVVTTVANGQANFFSPAGTMFTGNLADGPGYGAISTGLAGIFGSSQPGVEDTIHFVLNFSGAVSQSQISNLVLSFGSPDTVRIQGVPDSASTLALLGLALIGVGFLRRKMSKNPLTLA